MSDLLKDISTIFKSVFNYSEINKISGKYMRKCNHENSITLEDAVNYRFSYTKIGTTKQSICSSINMINEKSTSRQNYEKKEANIPFGSYNNAFELTTEYYETHYGSDKENPIAIAVDGVYTNDSHGQETSNIGFFNITDGYPLTSNLQDDKVKTKKLSYLKII